MKSLIASLVTTMSVFAVPSVFASQDSNEFSEQNAMQVSFGSEYREAQKTKRVFPRRIHPPGERVFIFSPKYQSWGAYSSDGKLVGYGRANGGATFCKDIGRPCRTPRGSFRVHSKGLPSCRSSKYPLPRGGAPMPYCMHFLKSYAIHGSPGIANYNSSHGCIRVYNEAAKWLSNNFIKHGTRVIVMSY